MPRSRSRSRSRGRGRRNRERERVSPSSRSRSRGRRGRRGRSRSSSSKPPRGGGSFGAAQGGKKGDSDSDAPYSPTGGPTGGGWDRAAAPAVESIVPAGPQQPRLDMYDNNGWLKPGAAPPPPPPGPPPGGAPLALRAKQLLELGGMPSGGRTSTAASGSASGLTGAALARMGRLPATAANEPQQQLPVCTKFLAGLCPDKSGCLQRHPDSPKEIAHWLSFFSRKHCKWGRQCIWRPHCVFFHPELQAKELAADGTPLAPLPL